MGRCLECTHDAKIEVQFPANLNTNQLVVARLRTETCQLVRPNAKKSPEMLSRAVLSTFESDRNPSPYSVVVRNGHVNWHPLISAHDHLRPLSLIHPSSSPSSPSSEDLNVRRVLSSPFLRFSLLRRLIRLSFLQYRRPALRIAISSWQIHQLTW